MFHFVFIISFFFLPKWLLGETLYDYEVIVVDSKDIPLVGVNVYSEGYTLSGYTDENGKFILKDVNYKDEISFSYVGYKGVTLPFFEIRKRSGKIKLYEELNLINEIVVIGRRDQVKDEVSYQLEVISDKELAFTNSQTSADVLSKEGNVFVQKSQMGGGSPIIRGFEANRVLLVIDGVRLNNAIYRNGHLQNSITIDPSILQRAEIIFGPSSLTYGSDALGGVVHFRTKDPLLTLGIDEDVKTKINASLRYATANIEKTAHLDLNYAKAKWGSLTSLTFTDYDDLRAGSKRPEGLDEFGKRFFYQFRENDVEGSASDQTIENLSINSKGDTIKNYNLQVGTAYWQADMLQKIKYQANKKLALTANIQFSTSSDVPRYDNLSEVVYDPQAGADLSNQRKLKWSDWYYGPQQRFLFSIKAQLNSAMWYDKATIIAAFQKINEDRISRKFNRADKSFNLETVKVYSLSADFSKNIGLSNRLKLEYGAEYSHNDVSSIAGKTNLSTRRERIGGALSRYPLQGSIMNQSGVYSLLKLQSKDMMKIFEGGLRYSSVYLQSVFSPNDPINWPEVWTSGNGITSRNQDLTYGLSMVLRTENKINLRLLSSKAFRSPNIDDFAKIREKGGFITIPNPDLKPEKAYSFEASLGKDFGNPNSQQGNYLRLSATTYHTFLRDAISRRNHPLPDPDNLIPDNEQNQLFEIDILPNGDTLVESYTTQANLNAQNGFVQGLSLNLQSRFARFWSLKGSLNFTKGQVKYKQNYFQTNDNGTEQLIASIDTIVPIDHIPPTYGNISIGYEKNKLKLLFKSDFVAAKKLEDYGINAIAYNPEDNTFSIDRLGSADNLDQTPLHREIDPGTGNITASNYLGSYAYILLHFYASYQLNSRLILGLNVENIADIHYRPFASGVSGAGRNLIVSIRGTF